MRLISVFAVSLALAACGGPAGEATDLEAAGVDDPGAPAAAQPQPRPVTFEALSKTAEAFTGNISLSAIPRVGPSAAPAMRLEAANGLVYEAELVAGGADLAESVDWSALFGVPFDPASREPGAPSIDLSMVTKEVIPDGLANGGLCGDKPVFALAMAMPLSSGAGPMIGVAAFSGEQWPPSDESALCGVFNYAPPR